MFSPAIDVLASAPPSTAVLRCPSCTEREQRKREQKRDGSEAGLRAALTPLARG